MCKAEIPPHGGEWGQIAYDFSVSLNPLGMPDAVREALAANVDLYSQYPDPYCGRLTRSLSERLKIPEAQIVSGNGAAELIYRIAGVLTPKRALVVAPCFSEYEKALSEQICQTEFLTLSAETGFALQAVPRLSGKGYDLVIAASPNNPTGRCLSAATFEELLSRCEEAGAVLLLDACFCALSVPEKEGALSLSELLCAVQKKRPLIVLSAFTKTYALAGLRLGYALCGDLSLAEALRRSGQHWKVSTPALLAGETALSMDEAYLNRAQALIKTERQYLREALSALALTVFPSDANFLFFRLAPEVRADLLREGIALRPCGNFRGLSEDFCRAAVRAHTENEILITALGRALSQWQKH